MDVLQIALVWVCLIADPSKCVVHQGESFMGPVTTPKNQQQCKEEIIKLAIKINKSLDPSKWILVSSGCSLEKNKPRQYSLPSSPKLI